MLRRAGEVFTKVIEKPSHAARIGGDEFAILSPETDERGGMALVASIGKVIELNNQFYPGAPLSVALGVATTRAGERLEDVAKRADALMYQAKQAYYAGPDAYFKPRSQASQVLGAAWREPVSLASEE